jgi:hypothetical protein
MLNNSTSSTSSRSYSKFAASLGVPDLEANALLHQEIITKCMEGSPLFKEAQSMHANNIKMLTHLIALHKQQKEAEYKKLTTSQLLADVKFKEREIQLECNEKLSDLTEILSRKEQSLKRYEDQFVESKLLLLKHIDNEDVENLFNNKQNMHDKSDQFISSVIQENEKLTKSICQANEQKYTLKTSYNSLLEEQKEIMLFGGQTPERLNLSPIGRNRILAEEEPISTIKALRKLTFADPESHNPETNQNNDTLI